MTSKKKTLIITLFGDYNYGNKLQNYALEYVLKNLDVIPYTARVKYIYNDNWLNTKRLIKTFLDYLIKSRIERCRLKKFVEFDVNYLNMTREKYKTNKSKNDKFISYDYCIFGSDQIWNPICFGTSDLFLGYNSAKNKNIVYAGSFGIEKIPDELKKRYHEGIQNYKHISVRETAGVKIIKGLDKSLNVKCVLDPTMLLNMSQWNKLVQPIPKLEDKKYILLYFLGELSKKDRDVIELYARTNGLRIVELMNKEDEFYSSNPNEFLYLEKYAELICTDSFHSCVFAVIFQRPFLAFDRKGGENMNSRLETLLETFELQQCKYSGVITKECMNVDFKKCNQILCRKQKESLSYLKESLID